MEEKINISVVMAFYNTGNDIKRALDSIINQIYKVYEIILINDGSTDNTKNIILPYLKKYKFIKYFEQKNKGISFSRNKGLFISKGDYIYFMDADDYLDKKAFNKLVKLLCNKKYDFIKFNYYYSTKNKLKCSKGNIIQFKSDYLKSILTGIMLTYVPCLLISKNFLLYNNILFEENINYMEDKIFYYDIFYKSNNYLIGNDLYLYYYFYHGNNNKEYWIKCLKEVNNVYKILLNRQQTSLNNLNVIVNNSAFSQINTIIFNIVINDKKIQINKVNKYFSIVEKDFYKCTKVSYDFSFFINMCLIFKKYHLNHLLIMLYNIKKIKLKHNINKNILKECC